MEKQDLQTGLALIRKDFSLAQDEFDLKPDELTSSHLLDRLTRLVAYLMEKDFGKLLQVLYRIDIPEEKLKAALASNEGSPSELVAQMIFEREMQKVETRKRYK